MLTQKGLPVTRAEKLGIQPWRRVGNTFIGIAENIAKVPWFETFGLWRHSFSRGLCRLYGRRMEKQSTTLQEHDGRFYLFGSWDFFNENKTASAHKFFANLLAPTCTHH